MTTTVTITHADHGGADPRPEKVRVEQVDTMAGGHRILVADLAEKEQTTVHLYGSQTIVLTEVKSEEASWCPTRM